MQRLPKGTVPDLNGLIREMQEADRAAQEQAAMQVNGMNAGMNAQTVVEGLPPEYRQVFDGLAPEQQAAMLAEIGVTE